MGDFFRYLADRRRTLLLFAVSCAFFAVSFALYGIPVGAVLYPAGLTVLFLLSCAVPACLRSRRKRKRLEGLCGMPPPLCSPLPEASDDTERAYQALVAHLLEEYAELGAKDGAELAERMGYFTAWTHQIKTPIAAMDLRLRGEDTRLARELRTDLGRVERYADMALAYLRLDARGNDFVLREFDLEPVARGAVKKFAGEFILKKLRVETGDLSRRVVSDEKWLSFILEQVLSNALKYTKEGTVLLRAEGDGGRVCLLVSDTGVGIAPEDLPRIFENGYTGQNGRADRRATGIGLYLAKRIADRLGHGLSAESEPGVGTTVRIELGRETVTKL